jgi:hypothetical protein
MIEIREGTFQRQSKNTKTIGRKQAEEICRAGKPPTRGHGNFFMAPPHSAATDYALKTAVAGGTHLRLLEALQT